MTISEQVRETILALVEHFGSQALLAKAAGVRQPTVSNWCRGEQQPGPKAAVNIEKATGSRWTRYDLRDDAFDLWPQGPSSC